MRIYLIALLLALVLLPYAGICQESKIQMDNKRIVLLHLEHLKSADRKLIVSDWAEDAMNFGKPAGRQGIIDLFDDLYTTFPDYRFDLVDMIAEDEVVSVRVKASGTHLGMMKKTIRQLREVPPTKKQFVVDHIHWYKVKNGKIIDDWAVRDDLKMMEQLGIIPLTTTPTK